MNKKIRIWIISFLLISLTVSFLFCLPSPLFKAPFSTILLDRDGKLIGASIADDEQWRFAATDNIPEKLIKAITIYEDRRFFKHIGVDLIAVVRAIYQNIKADKIVSGASTITMQVIRLARNGQPRTFTEKFIEMLLALRLEISKNKKEIFSLYSSYAPFGGNVVGIEAASWRYFGRELDKLSWAENAMLAVLPNNPSLVHPGRNRQKLLLKRNMLLDKLHNEGIIDLMTCELSKEEPLPPKPYPIPMLATHLMDRIKASEDLKKNGYRITTTLKKELQTRAIEIIERHHKYLSRNGIYNAAALVLEVETGDTLAYIGNVSQSVKSEHGHYVDIINSPRSTGSILKPLLYAAMLDSGDILPFQLIPDIPVRMGSFAPQNFSQSYQGAVPAYMALARSLNIPAVYMLHSYGVDRFCSILRQLGMTTLFRPASNYGLSLIIGGAEGTLWDITGIYAGMARRINNHSYKEKDKIAFFPPKYLKNSIHKSNLVNNPLNPSSCWLTFEALLEVTRPGRESTWRDFTSSQYIAWKTGTSFGFRDGWAIGVTPYYTVGVWVGNADGEGRAGLIGVDTAAPIMFELFGLLNTIGWFKTPENELIKLEICAESGYMASPNCAKIKTIFAPKAGFKSAQCPFCKNIHCDSTMKWRVHSECERIADMNTVKWFVLPPGLEWYYKKNHSDYNPLPSYRPDCLSSITNTPTSTMTLIYPDKDSKIYVPIELDGKIGRTVFEAAHRNPQTTIYWHLDDEYLGETRTIHQIALAPIPGEHILTLVDKNGESFQRKFLVLTK
ncbi:MAG: penicillin-binding protein 1C [Desulfobacterales bacterium]|nr:penicillin-binding protein 1C [Desulfobacterales bacterium]MBF0397831.1 penicillin-binding protein 1C [Desulfobacterales bacterium]